MPNLIDCTFHAVGPGNPTCPCKTCEHAWELENCCNIHTYHAEERPCNQTCSGYTPHTDKPKSTEKPGKQINLGGLL
jgi:hypothetical protein